MDAKSFSAMKTAVMSSKGQVVIPDAIRREVEAGEGTMFSVIGKKDIIVLRKLRSPSREQILQDLQSMTREVTAELKRKGITEQDLINIALKARHK